MTPKELRKRLKAGPLGFILCESLGLGELRALAQKVRVSHPAGVWNTGIEEEAAHAIALEVLYGAPDPDGVALLVGWIEEAHRDLLAELRKLDRGALAARAEARIDPENLRPHAALLWALATDPGWGISKLQKVLEGRILATFLREETPPGRPVDLPLAKEPPSRGTLEQAYAHHRDRRLRARAEELERAIHERDQKLGARKRELEAARMEAARLAAALEEERCRSRCAGSRERRMLEHERQQLAAERTRLGERAARAAELEAENAALRVQLEEARKERDAARARVAQLERELGETRVALKARRPPDPSRVAILVDTYSLFPLARRRGARVDYDRIHARTRRVGSILSATAYLADVPNADSAAVQNALKLQGYSVQVRRLEGLPPLTDAGPWAGEIADQARLLASSCGTIALATADPHLAPLVGELGARGTAVVLFTFPDDAPPALLAAAGEVIPIDESLLRLRPQPAAPARAWATAANP